MAHTGRVAAKVFEDFCEFLRRNLRQRTIITGCRLQKIENGPAFSTA